MKKFILSVVLLVATQAVNAQSLNLSLQDCRRMALEFDERVKTASSDVEKAKLDREIAFAMRLPKVDGSITGIHTKNHDFVGLSLQTRGTYLAGINVVMPLYTGGQLTAASNLTKIGQEVSEEKLRKTRMQLISDVDNTYYSLISVRAKVKMLEAYAVQMKELYDKVQLSVNVELATENDLLRITTKQSEVNYMLLKARNGEKLCQLALANMIGTDFDQDITPTDTLLQTVISTDLDEDISSRPDLLLLQHQVKANEVLVKKARANYLPTVALVGGFSHFDNIKLKGTVNTTNGNQIDIDHRFSGNSPMLMLAVNVPIFHWGAELKKVKKAKLDLNDSMLQLQQYERGMRVEVRKAILNIRDGQNMVETATLGQKQADENLRVMREKYENQLCTITDYLDAQSQWQQSHSNLIEAQTQLKIYETEYLRVTGRLE